jgi:hypothetical protein
MVQNQQKDQLGRLMIELKKLKSFFRMLCYDINE